MIRFIQTAFDPSPSELRLFMDPVSQDDAMKITAVETIQIEEFSNFLWLRIETDEGLVGLGEQRLEMPLLLPPMSMRPPPLTCLVNRRWISRSIIML